MSKQYGSADFLISDATPSQGDGTVRYYSNNEKVCTVSQLSGTVRIIAVGTCTISAEIDATASYEAAQTKANIEITVTPAPLVITASSATISTDPGLYVVTPSYSAFQNGETQAVLTVTPTCSSDYFTRVGVFAEDRTVTTYKTFCSGASASNYEITYVGGLLTHIRRDD